MSKLSRKTLQALRVISKAPNGTVSAGWFAVAMDYGDPNASRFRMKGPTGAAVLKRLQKRGLTKVWDEFLNHGYVTLACLTLDGKHALDADS